MQLVGGAAHSRSSAVGRQLQRQAGVGAEAAAVVQTTKSSVPFEVRNCIAMVKSSRLIKKHRRTCSFKAVSLRASGAFHLCAEINPRIEWVVKNAEIAGVPSTLMCS